MKPKDLQLMADQIKKLERKITLQAVKLQAATDNGKGRWITTEKKQRVFIPEGADVGETVEKAIKKRRGVKEKFTKKLGEKKKQNESRQKSIKEQSKRLEKQLKQKQTETYNKTLNIVKFSTKIDNHQFNRLYKKAIASGYYTAPEIADYVSREIKYEGVPTKPKMENWEKPNKKQNESRNKNIKEQNKKLEKQLKQKQTEIYNKTLDIVKFSTKIDNHQFNRLYKKAIASGYYTAPEIADYVSQEIKYEGVPTKPKMESWEKPKKKQNESTGRKVYGFLQVGQDIDETHKIITGLQNDDLITQGQKDSLKEDLMQTVRKLGGEDLIRQHKKTYPGKPNRADPEREKSILKRISELNKSTGRKGYGFLKVGQDIKEARQVITGLQNDNLITQGQKDSLKEDLMKTIRRLENKSEYPKEKSLSQKSFDHTRRVGDVTNNARDRIRRENASRVRNGEKKLSKRQQREILREEFKKHRID